MLSNKERKYRCKIIVENHLKKDAQRYIDFYITKNSTHQINLTYKYLYFNYGLLHSILVKYNFSKLSNAMKDMRTSCTKAASAFQNFTASLNEFNNNNNNNNNLKR